jgi:hypothetical protein
VNEIPPGSQITMICAPSADRQQVKWLALTAAGFVVCLLIALLALAGGQAWLTTAGCRAVQLIALFGIPAAMTLAILKHRLYGIDVIISRAVVYGLLSAATAGVYAGIVLGIGATGADGPRPGSGSARSCARPRSGRPGRLCRPPSRSAPTIACRVLPGHRGR